MNKHIIFAILSLVPVVWSCNDYETVPVDKFTDEYIFSPTDSLGVKAKKYLTYIYSAIPDGHDRISGGDYLDAATDDAVSSDLTENDVYKLSVGRYNPTSLIGTEIYWYSFYNAIHRATNTVNNIHVVPLQETFNNGIPLVRAWKAEARFLRAYFYFELVKRYGGVPLLGDRLYSLEDDVEFPRNSFEECIDYIVGELDDIKDSLRTLPFASPDEDGHAVTGETAMALKSRVLLYAASPLFNGQTLEAGNKLVGYTDYQPERWREAAEAARWFIDTYGPNGTNKFELVPDFRDVFLNRYGGGFKEMIFFRQHDGKASKGVEQKNGPVGFSGTNLARGRTSPTQDLVDAFPMKNGKHIGDPASGYNSNAPYDNRDPRLGYTILHNGSQWLNTQLETYSGGISNPSANIQKTKTSYYMRKFMGKFEDKSFYEDVAHMWVMFRYAEILLNFAEAQNEYAGPTGEVYQAIKDLRKRAGIEPGSDDMYGLDAGMTKDEMREIIRNERRIELAFEEHRFYDIRRWKIAESIFRKPLYGLVIIKQASGFGYNETEVLNAPFDPKRYLHPIPYTEVIKNRNMVQNPLW